MSAPTDKDGTFFYVLQDALKIIYVDDDPILREFAVVNLTTEHATVATACDGEEAIRVIDGYQPDIMLLDLDMPNVDGFEVLEHLRATPKWRDLPVIVVTGREDVSAVDRAFQAGATSFVVKPLNWRLLSYQIRYVHRARPTEGPSPAEVQLQRLALESSKFLAAALQREPGLRPLAAGFARVADEVLTGGRPDEAAA
jgi:DNA-binding response OmpR family regulator